MATFLAESYFSGNNGSHFKQSLYYDLSQDTTNNKSYITYYAYVGSVDGYSGSGSTAYVYINGSQVGTFTSLSSYSSGTLRGTLSVEVSHNSDGTASASYSMTTDTSWTLGDSNLSGSFTLPTIPRQANITGANDFTDEDNPSFTFSNPGGFTMNVWLEPNPVGDHLCVRNNIPNTGSYTWSLTNEERESLRRACVDNKCTVRIGLYTIIGSTTYASYVDKIMTIVNGNPTFTNFEFEDINETTLALTGNNQYNINGYSNIKATISTTDKAIANKEATMSKYRFMIGNTSTDITYSDDSDVFGVINNAQNGTYQVYAIDSRNNSTLVTKLANQVISYENIYLNPTSSNVQRDDNQVGTAAILTLNGTFWNDNFGTVNNAIESVSYKFKKTSSSTWIDGTTTITPTISNNTFSFTGEIASDNQDTSWDLQDSYNVQIIVEDKLSISTINLILNSAIPTMSFDKNGVGVMCVYDSNLGGKLQVGGKKIAYSGTVLYENSSGTTGTVTLSDSVENYDFIEIYVLSIYDPGTGYAQNSTKVWQPNGKSAWVTSGYTNTGDNQYNLKISTVLLTGNQITRTYGGWEFTADNSSKSTAIAITKVIGYKED